MAEDFAAVLGACMDFLKIQYNLYGYSISFWNIISFLIVSGVCGWLVWTILNRD